MDISWLESFMALLEHGSFSRAAEAQHVSQPAFSRRIRSLERWVGTELVDRTSTPLTATPAGETLRREAVQVLLGLSTVRQELRSRARVPLSAVRVGLSHTLAVAFFPQWWSGLALAFGGAQPACRLVPGNTLDTYEALRHGTCDLLLAYVDPVSPRLLDPAQVEARVVATDALAPYVGSANPSAPSQVAQAWEATPRRAVPFLGHGANAFFGRMSERVAARHDLSLRSVLECELTVALAGAAEAGLGVAWLPRAIGDATPGLARVPGEHLEAPLSVQLHRVRGARLGAAALRLWEVAVDPSEVLADPAGHSDARAGGSEPA